MSNAQTYGVNLIPQTPIINPLATFTAAAASANVTPGKWANVRISVTGQPLWIKIGSGSQTATAGAGNEILCPVGHTDINMGENTDLAYIQDAASAKGCIYKF